MSSVFWLVSGFGQCCQRKPSAAAGNDQRGWQGLLKASEQAAGAFGLHWAAGPAGAVHVAAALEQTHPAQGGEQQPDEDDGAGDARAIQAAEPSSDWRRAAAPPIRDVGRSAQAAGRQGAVVGAGPQAAAAGAQGAVRAGAAAVRAAEARAEAGGTRRVHRAPHVGQRVRHAAAAGAVGRAPDAPPGGAV
eukprot:2711540-Prymnesium_polylepis.1